MTLVDTSVWVEHFRGRARAAPLVTLLASDGAATHPFVAGELALGHLGARRPAILHDLALLPALSESPHHDVLALVTSRALHGSGIGWVDAHLLSAAIAGRTDLWTFDAKLAAVARKLGVAFMG